MTNDLNDHFAKDSDSCPKYTSQWFITKHLSHNAFNL